MHQKRSRKKMKRTQRNGRSREKRKRLVGCKEKRRKKGDEK